MRLRFIGFLDNSISLKLHFYVLSVVARLNLLSWHDHSIEQYPSLPKIPRSLHSFHSSELSCSSPTIVVLIYAIRFLVSARQSPM